MHVAGQLFLMKSTMVDASVILGWGVERTEFKALEKENQRLRNILADLELDKLILNESFDDLKPRV